MSVAPRLALCSAAIGLLLAGCGGGSSPTADTPVATRSSGVAVDGYIRGATVVCDANGNGVADTGEATTTTDARGGFTFAPACTSPIAVSGGVNVDTGFDFVGVLRAPAGAIVASPLTTLMVAGNLTAAEVAAALGLPAGTDVTRVDPADGSNPALFKKTLAVQQLMMEAAEALGPAGGDAARINALYSQVGAALAGTIKSTPGARIVGADGSVNFALVTGVLERVAAAAGTTLAAERIASIADQIAQQAEKFLNASDAEIVAVSRKWQAPSVKVDLGAPASYLALAGDAVLLNGAPTTLAALSGTGGVTVTDLRSLGLEFSPVGAPAIDATIGVGVALTEVGGTGRKLTLMIDRVGMSYEPTSGAWQIKAADTAKVYVKGLGADGTEIDMVIADLSFKPLAVAGNTLTLDYLKMIDKVLASASADRVKTTAEQFRSIKGTFDLSLVVTRLNIRRLDGSAFTPVTVAIPGVNGLTLSGNGVQGRVVLN